MSALTTAQAAALAGMARDTFHREMSRERGRGRDYRLPRDQWPDQRTPLWDEALLTGWLAGRPGRGNWSKARAAQRADS